MSINQQVIMQTGFAIIVAFILAANLLFPAPLFILVIFLTIMPPFHQRPLCSAQQFFLQLQTVCLLQ